MKAASANGTNRPTSWSRRIGVVALVGAILAVLVAILATTLARYGVVAKLSGFMWFLYSQAIAAGSALIGVVALAIAFMRKTTKVPAVAAIALALVMIALFYALVIRPGSAVPPLHDVTTDLDDPPEFRTLTLREDNLVGFNNIEEWRSAHREGYPDIAPIIIDKAPARVLADARALAEQRGWDIASVDPLSGHMEATAYAGYIRFMDDVIVEVTPIADGSTRVDMRSVSRVGMSDLGYNAERIRDFLRDLQAA